MTKIDIEDDDFLLRRFPKDSNFSYVKPDGTLTSLVFKARRKDTDGLSVDVERFTSYKKAIIDSVKYGLCKIQTRIIRNEKLDCIHTPIKDNPAHALIIGNITNSISKKFSYNSKIIEL